MISIERMIIRVAIPVTKAEYTIRWFMFGIVPYKDTPPSVHRFTLKNI